MGHQHTINPTDIFLEYQLLFNEQRKEVEECLSYLVKKCTQREEHQRRREANGDFNSTEGGWCSMSWLKGSMNGSIIPYHYWSAKHVTSVIMEHHQPLFSAIHTSSLSLILFSRSSLRKSINLSLWLPLAHAPSVLPGKQFLSNIFTLNILPNNFSCLLLIVFVMTLSALTLLNISSLVILTIQGTVIILL